MPSFRLSPAAKSDLKKIARYTQKEWGKQKRDEYLSVIDATFNAISNAPLIGLDRTDVEPGLRSLPPGKYCLHIIFYRIRHDTVEIIRILHHAMGIQRQFNSMK